MRTPTLDDVFMETTGTRIRAGRGPRVTTAETAVVMAQEAGFLQDVRSVAGRALRQIPREPAAVIPAVFVPAFFYAVNLGALEKLAGTTLDYKAFLLPMAIAFAVTGMSRAPALVTDIQGGYFDRLCMTPIRRSALLLGLMVADVAVIVALCVPVLVIGAIVGVRFATGLPGLLVFVGFSALWGLAFTGFPYAVALKTGSPAAVNACYVLFFPLFFLTDAVVPKQLLTGWFSDYRHIQPGHLSPGRATVAHHIGVANRTAVGGFGRSRRASAGRYLACPDGAAGKDPDGRLNRPSRPTVVRDLPADRELSMRQYQRSIRSDPGVLDRLAGWQGSKITSGKWREPVSENSALKTAHQGYRI